MGSNANPLTPTLIMLILTLALTSILPLTLLLTLTRLPDQVLGSLPVSTRDAIERLARRRGGREGAILLIHRDPGRFEHFATLGELSSEPPPWWQDGEDEEEAEDRAARVWHGDGGGGGEGGDALGPEWLTARDDEGAASTRRTRRLGLGSGLRS